MAHHMVSLIKADTSFWAVSSLDTFPMCVSRDHPAVDGIPLDLGDHYAQSLDVVVEDDG